MVPYQKGKQILKAAVPILKMIRLPPLLSYKPSKVDVDPRKRHKRLSANLIVGNDYWWYLFGMIPFACAWVSFALFDEDPHPVTYVVFFFGLLIFHMVALHSVVYWHREMSPFRLIGAKAKFMIEVIPVIVAAALPHLLEFDDAYYALLLSCTTYFYTFAHSFAIISFEFLMNVQGPLSSSFPIENRNVPFLDINADVPALAECVHTQSAVPEGYQLLIESMASAS
ncbi:hypothetical protein T459_18532 [Capsicum annuum]|uniref:Uncharacterized protein n=1 Tax=Capsicum annuum TaxID=4072 RepID=A0A2G2ZER2_CAPAN|nr:hypothetical protein T459_18532 [Capsicum annuum]